MKTFTKLLLLWLLVAFGSANAQTTLSTETFPNSFNTGFTKPINSTFLGSTGTWSAYSNTSYGTVAVNGEYFKSSPYALKLINYISTGCSSVTYAIATSPTTNCTTSCYSSLSLCFSLYTACVVSTNNSFILYVEVSKDNGATWTTLLGKTAAQLFASYGQGTWNNICLTLPSTYNNSSFKYRLVGAQNANCSSNNFLFIDDIQIKATSCATLTLGNLVWLDANGNNMRDASEPGVPNATVKLYADANNDNLADGAAVRTTTTDASGNYTFTGLSAGNYIAGVIIPANYTRGAAATADPDDNVDNDNNAANQIGASTAGGEMRSKAITLSQGAEPTTDGDDNNGNLTLDLALCPAGNLLSLGNLVWLDLNGNNTKEANEPSVPNATVNLYTDANNDNVIDGAAVATTTTNASGNYVFTGLNSGNYIVGVIIPSGYTKGAASTVDPDNNVDNDNNGVNLIGTNGAGGEVRTLAVTLTPFSEPTTDGDDNNGNQTVDIALCPAPGLLKLGNLVWLDINANNLKDANEPVIPNATVRLYADANNDNAVDGAALASTNTDANGIYAFTGLNSGNYIVGLVIPPGYQARINTGNDPDNDVDNDNNGVTLLGANQPGSEVRSLAITLQAFTEPTTDGDDNNGNQTLDIALCPAPNNLTLGNLVFLDVNGNNVKDATDPVIPNATVNLYRDADNNNVADGTAIATTTTNTNGFYSFIGLAADNYIVGVIIPENNQARINGTIDPDNDIDNDNNGVNLTGSNIPGNEVRSNAITLSPFTEPTTDGDDSNANQTLDFGFCPAPGGLNLGNFVWNDYDGDGKKDPNEPGIGNAPVSLYKDDNNDNIPDKGTAIATSTSSATGYYSFTNLTPGRYIVALPILPGYLKSPNSSTQTTSPFPDNNLDNDNNLVRLVGPNGPGGVMFSNSITLTFGEEPTTDGDGANGNLTMDMALCGNAYLGDFVWNDLNGNGIQDAGEPGINGQTVTILFPDGVTTATTTTLTFNGTDGYYNFPNLGPGAHVITFTTPAGLTPSPANQGGDDTKDSDPVNGSVTVNVVANASDFTIDAGFKTPSTIGLGNLVFIDLNGNGIRDASEAGIPGATVNLYRDSNGDNAPDGAAILATTTANDGTYHFTGLSSDSYIVGVMLPSGYYFIAGNPLPNNDIDNDNNAVRQIGTEVRTNFITLSAGTEPTTDGDDNNTNSTLDIALLINCPPTAKGSATTITGKGVTAVTTDVVERTMSIYPNPAISRFTVKVSTDKQSAAAIWITDSKGKTTSMKSVTLVPGTNLIQMNADSKMASGVYTISTVVNGNVTSQRLVVAK